MFSVGEDFIFLLRVVGANSIFALFEVVICFEGIEMDLEWVEISKWAEIDSKWAEIDSARTDISIIA